MLTGISFHRWAGGLIGLVAAFALLGGAAVSLAEPADQSATATPVATVAGTTAATGSPTAAAASGTAAPAVTCVTTTQGIQVQIGSPNPGDVLTSGGNVVVSGVAYDPAATQGSGIDRVNAYLGSRDAGGTFLGTASLGQPSPMGGAAAQFTTAGYTLRSVTLPTGTGGRSLFVYAHSSLSDKEASTSVPVFLGAVPTPVKGQVPTAVVAAAPACTPTPVPTNASTSTPVPPTATATNFVLPAPVATSTPVATVPPISLQPATTPIIPVVIATATPIRTAVTTASASAATAPRGGGIPVELGYSLLVAGALVVGGGLTLRRRDRGAPSQEGDHPSAV